MICPKADEHIAEEKAQTPKYVTVNAITNVADLFLHIMQAPGHKLFDH